MRQIEQAFEWEETGEGVRLLRVYARSGEIRLPQEIEGRPIVELGAYCFARANRVPQDAKCSVKREELEELREIAGERLETLILPESVRVIGNCCFYNCKELRAITIGSKIHAVNSDAFLNCRNLHLIRVDGDIEQKSGVRLCLNQISHTIAVRFEQGEITELIYPEYSESYEEIGPAHIFSMNIQGIGFRLRKCFKEDVVDLMQYDEAFLNATEKGDESKEMLARWCEKRLVYTKGLSKNARKRYETYLREQIDIMLDIWIKRQEEEPFRKLCERGIFERETIQQAIRQASDAGWVQGVAAWMELSKEKEQKKASSRYQF